MTTQNSREPDAEQQPDAEQEPNAEAVEIQTEAEVSPEREQPDITELQDRWRRALADLENLRKRHARELDQARAAERTRVAAAWLPVVDNLELALEHVDADPESILEGVRAIRDQAVDVLERLGYPRREEVGVPFDPNQHEVVNVVESSETEPGTVVQVLRPGYGNVDNQLRPTAVAVTRQSG